MSTTALPTSVFRTLVEKIHRVVGGIALSPVASMETQDERAPSRAALRRFRELHDELRMAHRALEEAFPPLLREDALGYDNVIRHGHQVAAIADKAAEAAVAVYLEGFASARALGKSDVVVAAELASMAQEQVDYAHEYRGIAERLRSVSTRARETRRAHELDFITTESGHHLDTLARS